MNWFQGQKATASEIAGFGHYRRAGQKCHCCSGAKAKGFVCVVTVRRSCRQGRKQPRMREDVSKPTRSPWPGTGGLQTNRAAAKDTCQAVIGGEKRGPWYRVSVMSWESLRACLDASKRRACATRPSQPAACVLLIASLDGANRSLSVPSGALSCVCFFISVASWRSVVVQQHGQIHVWRESWETNNGVRTELRLVPGTTPSRIETALKHRSGGTGLLGASTGHCLTMTGCNHGCCAAVRAPRDFATDHV
jgi:hypothetical protein